MASRASRFPSLKPRSPSKTPHEPRSPDSSVKKHRSSHISKARSPAAVTLTEKTSALVEAATAAGVKVDLTPYSLSPSDASGQHTSAQHSHLRGTTSKENNEPSPLVGGGKRRKNIAQAPQIPDDQVDQERCGMRMDTITKGNELKQHTDFRGYRGKPSVLAQASLDFEIPKRKRLETPPHGGQGLASNEQASKEGGRTSAITIKKNELKQPSDVQNTGEKPSASAQTSELNEGPQQNTDFQENRSIVECPSMSGQEWQVQEKAGGAEGSKSCEDGKRQPLRSGRRKSATFALSPLGEAAPARSPRDVGSPSAHQSGAEGQTNQDGTKKNKHRGYWSPPVGTSGTPPVSSRRQSVATSTSNGAKASATTVEGGSQWKTNPLLALIIGASRPRKASGSPKKQRVSSTAPSIEAESFKRRRKTDGEAAAEPSLDAGSPGAKCIAVFGHSVSPRLGKRPAVLITPEESGPRGKRGLVTDEESPLHALYSRTGRACLVCLSCGLVAALGLAIFFGTQHTTMERIKEAPNENPLRQLCVNQVCKSLVDRLLGSTNASVDPCTDFHSHVCDRWDHSTRVRGKRQSYMQENLTNHTLRLHRALEGVTSSPALLDQAEHNMALFYRSCHNFLDENRKEAAKESTVPEILREMGIDESSVRVTTFQDVFALAFAESGATGLPSILEVTHKTDFGGDGVLTIINVGATLASALPEGYVEGYLDDSISQTPFASHLDVLSVVKLDRRLDEFRAACEYSTDSVKPLKELGEPFPGADWLQAFNDGHAQNMTSLYTPDSNVTVRGEQCIFSMLNELYGVNVTEARAYSLLVMTAQIKKYAYTLRPWLHDETHKTTECVSITARIFRALFLTWIRSKVVGQERTRAFEVMMNHLQEAVDGFSGLPEHLNVTPGDYEARHLTASIIAPDVYENDKGEDSGSIRTQYGGSFLLNVVRAKRWRAGSQSVSTDDDMSMALRGTVTFTEPSAEVKGGRELSAIVPATFVTADLFVPEASEPALYYGSSGALLLLEWARAWLEGAPELREPIRLHHQCMQQYASLALGRDADPREALLLLTAGWALEVARSAAPFQQPEPPEGTAASTPFEESSWKTRQLRNQLFFYRFCSTTCGDAWAMSACRIGVHFSPTFRHAFGCSPPPKIRC